MVSISHLCGSGKSKCSVLSDIFHFSFHITSCFFLCNKTRALPARMHTNQQPMHISKYLRIHKSARAFLYLTLRLKLSMGVSVNTFFIKRHWIWLWAITIHNNIVRPSFVHLLMISQLLHLRNQSLSNIHYSWTDIEDLKSGGAVMLQ